MGKSIIKRTLLTILLAVISLPAMTQNRNLKIRGTVTDIESRAPIYQALIYSPDNRCATQSNEEGEYVISLTPNSKDERVVVSAFGYRKDTLRISDLARNPEIRLTKGSVLLKEVTITAYTPTGVIDEALRRIPENYQTDTTLNTFFFRIYRTLDDSLYLFCESLLHSRNEGYDKHLKKRQKRRTLTNTYLVDISHLPVYDTNLLYDLFKNKRVASELISINRHLYFDHILKPSESTFLTSKQDIRDRYAYAMQEISNDEGEAYFLISITWGKTKATLTVNKNDFAITDIAYSIDTATLHLTKNDTATYAPYTTIHYDKSITQYCYRKIGGKYTLVSYSNKFSFTLIGDSCASQKTLRYENNKIVQLVEQKDCDKPTWDSLSAEKHRLRTYIAPQPDSLQCATEYWDAFDYIPLRQSIRKQLPRRNERATD